MGSSVWKWFGRVLRISALAIACWFCFLAFRSDEASRGYRGQATAIESSIREKADRSDPQHLNLTSIFLSFDEASFFYELPNGYSFRLRLETDEGIEELAKVSSVGHAGTGILHLRLDDYSRHTRSCSSVEFYTSASGFRAFPLVSDAGRGWLECNRVYLAPQVLEKGQSVRRELGQLAVRPENSRNPGFRLLPWEQPKAKNMSFGLDSVCVLASFYRLRTINGAEEEIPAVIAIALEKD